MHRFLLLPTAQCAIVTGTSPGDRAAWNLPNDCPSACVAAAVCVHNENLAILLECIVIERRLVAEAVDATIPHDPAIRGPDRVRVSSW
jgi:hypothetical protein